MTDLNKFAAFLHLAAAVAYADSDDTDMAHFLATFQYPRALSTVPETCEDNGGDDSNHCYECLECLARLQAKFKRADRAADFCDESDRMASELAEEVAILKMTLGVE